jgi:hypothetical protein
LLDAGAALIQRLGEKCGLFLGVGAIGYHRADAALARRLAVGGGIVALTGNRGARCDLRANIEQRFKAAAIMDLAARQVKADWVTLLICF